MTSSHAERSWRPPSGILFAEDFDDAGNPGSQQNAHSSHPPPEPEFIAPTFSAAEMLAARQDGHAEGVRAAIEQAEAQLRADAALACQRIAAALELAQRDTAEIVERSVEAAARLLFTALAACLPTLCARHDSAEIAGIVHDVLFGMTPETTMCVSVAPEITAEVRAALVGLPADMSKRVVIAGHEGLASGDVRLSWESGTAARSARRAQDAINEILSRLGLLEPPAPNPTTAGNTLSRTADVPFVNTVKKMEKIDG
jgi:hypothetical protein